MCEDEDSIRDFVIINLERVGYNVTGVASGEAALDCFLKNSSNYMVVLLDVMLPGMDGFSVCKEIRRLNSGVGIIMLSAKSQEMDKVNGLMLGADDYISKPFSPSELIARVDALCRRMNAPAVSGGAKKNLDELVSGDFVLNTKTHTLTYLGKLVALTQVEYLLMEKFLSAPNTTIDRKELLESIWGNDFDGDEKIVDVNIRRLRMKIEENPSNPTHLTTVWGIGYKWLD